MGDCWQAASVVVQMLDWRCAVMRARAADDGTVRLWGPLKQPALAAGAGLLGLALERVTQRRRRLYRRGMRHRLRAQSTMAQGACK